MGNAESNVDFDIIQIGHGPVGKASSLFFSRLGWKVGVFERFAEIYPLPRAVCIDHELFRVLHAADMGDIADKVTSDAPVYRWYNVEWKELLAIDWTAGSVSGGGEVNFVHQPSFEKAMDAKINGDRNISVTFGAEAVGIVQDADKVIVTTKDSKTGKTSTHTARYVIGIDGANSFVRQSLKIGQKDLGFEADWLVIDFALNNGLTARDLGIPGCGQYCNPKRPTTIVPGGIDNGRVCRRWEFMRLPQETREEMLEESKVWELLGQWIKPDQGELVRHTVYTFRSLIADTWQDKRIFLAGDAAHVMPPFMGQGMCAGLRDVWNLSWKLDRVMRGKADASLLDTYQPERAPHVTDIIHASIFLGSIICIPDEQKAAERDAMFLGGTAPPPAPFPKLTDGFLERDDQGAVIVPAGDLSPAGAVRHHGKTGRLDSFVKPGFNLFLSPTLSEKDFDVASDTVCKAQNVNIIHVAERANAHDDEIGDTQGQLLRFMKQHGAEALLVRPDFYLFGGAKDAERLNAMLNNFGKQAKQHGLHK